MDVIAETLDVLGERLVLCIFVTKLSEVTSAPGEHLTALLQLRERQHVIEAYSHALDLQLEFYTIKFGEAVLECLRLIIWLIITVIVGDRLTLIVYLLGQRGGALLIHERPHDEDFSSFESLEDLAASIWSSRSDIFEWLVRKQASGSWQAHDFLRPLIEELQMS